MNLDKLLMYVCIQIVSLEKFSLSWRTSLRISQILQSLFNVWLPNSIQHMRQNGWLGQDKLSPQPPQVSRVHSSDIRSTPQIPQALYTPSQYAPLAHSPLPSSTSVHAHPTGSLSALNFSTWFNSPPAEHLPQSLDGIVTSINESSTNSMYPFAHANIQSPIQGATPSSSDFVRQLLSQQQYQGQGLENSDLSMVTRAPDLNYNIANWSDTVSTSEILSNFDFSIEAFNEMLKSSAAEAESV